MQVNALCTLFFIQPYRRRVISDQWIRFVKTKMGIKKTSTDSFVQTRAPASMVVSELKERLERRRTLVSNRNTSIACPTRIQMVTTIDVGMSGPTRNRNF